MRVVEMFCGAGGLSAGFKQAGFDVIHALDSWPAAIEVYRRNIGEHAWVADLSDINKVAPVLFGAHPDIIIGGLLAKNSARLGDVAKATGRISPSHTPCWSVLSDRSGSCSKTCQAP